MTDLQSSSRIADLKPDQPLAHLYTTEQERRAVLLPFVQQGLARGEKVLYFSPAFVSEANTSEASATEPPLPGFKAQPYLSSGQLEHDQDLSLLEIVDRLEAEVARTTNEAYPALRMACTVPQTPSGAAQLATFKTQLDQLAIENQLLVLCQYDRRRFDPATLLSVLPTYSTLIVDTSYPHDFCDTATRHSPDRPPGAASLDHWLSCMKQCQQATQALEKERAVASAVMDTLDALVIILDAQGRIIRLNQACEALSGYTTDQARGQYFWDLLLPSEETASVQSVFEALHAGQFPNQHTNYWRTKEGERHKIAWSNTAVLDKEGTVEYVIGTGIDVTGRTETENALRESEARYRLLFNSGTDAVFVHQLTPDGMPGQFIEVNDIACQRLGYTREELLRLTPQAVDAPEKREQIAAIMEKLLSDHYVLFETVHVARDGRHIPVEISAHLFELNGCPTVLSIARDITQRKQAQQALQESEQTARALLNASTDLTLLVDASCTILSINQAAARRFGASPEALVGTCVYDHIAPPLAERGKAQLEQVISSGQPTQFQIRWRDTVFDTSASPILDAQGQVKRLALFSRDVTDEVKAEKEIKQRNQELIVLNEISRAITSTLDLQETLTLITDNTNWLLGVEATAVVLRDEERGDLWFAAASGEGSSFVREMRLTLGQGIAGWVAQHGEAAIVSDTSQDPRFFGGFDRSSGFDTRSVLCVPMQTKGQTIGAIEAMNKKGGAFDQEDVRLLSALAASAAIAIENAQLFAQVRSGREQLQALSRRLVEVQESERRHISRELHDETGQALSSLLLGLSLLERKADDPEATAARAAELQGMVDRMLENLHRMAMNLRPASLDHLGLVAAMDQYCETFGQQHDLDVQFETVGLEMGERLLPEVETALYRIVQEALTNVIRHAQAEHVDVLLERRGDHVVTIVEDDGVGFDTHEVTQSGRLGVFGMHERAEMLDGNLVVESAPGTGTTVFVEVPYADQDPHR